MTLLISLAYQTRHRIRANAGGGTPLHTWRCPALSPHPWPARSCKFFIIAAKIYN